MILSCISSQVVVGVVPSRTASPMEVLRGHNSNIQRTPTTMSTPIGVNLSWTAVREGQLQYWALDGPLTKQFHYSGCRSYHSTNDRSKRTRHGTWTFKDEHYFIIKQHNIPIDVDATHIIHYKAHLWKVPYSISHPPSAKPIVCTRVAQYYEVKARCQSCPSVQ